VVEGIKSGEGKVGLAAIFHDEILFDQVIADGPVKGLLNEANGR